MRLIKGFLVILITLFFVITLFSLLLPSYIKVSRAVVINATTSNVYAQISNLHNWKYWEPLFANDSAIVIFSDSASGKMPYCDIHYKEKEIHLAITQLDSASIKFIVQSKGEDDTYNELKIIPVIQRDAVQVEWEALTKLRWYPWDKMYGIFMDGITGPGYEDALNHLKAFIEKK